MSVIAKMQLNGTLDFGSGSLSKLSCVCENDMMAAYAGANEDRLFTKYSPYGEMKLGHGFKDRNGMPKFQPGHKFYVMVLKNEKVDGTLVLKKPSCPGAEHVHPARCHAVHDFGTTKQVEVSHDGWPVSATSLAPEDRPGELHWRMSIDNPPAVAFFEPGHLGYWVAFYDADKFTSNEAIGDAHNA